MTKVTPGDTSVAEGDPSCFLEYDETEPAAGHRQPVTAFVGRTLKGPLHRAVSVDSFAQFQQIFGGLWQPSTVSYAVEQYFASGGVKALIVRVANSAHAPTLSLPAGAQALRLVGLQPGSREYLRASVDYDGCAESEALFNLVLQRVRAAGSERVEDQEIFRGISLRPDSDRFITAALLRSQLMRVIEPLPQCRPDRTGPGPGGFTVGYVGSNSDGNDGGAITDYDVIGSATDGTGLFALGAETFDFLCVPPLSREQDVGLGSLLVAARLCRERHALLIVDPPSAWTGPQEAIEAMRKWPFRSDYAVLYYPRLRALDRLRGRLETFACCGAAAGLLARAESRCPLGAADDEPVLRAGLQPAADVSPAQRVRLAQAGINTLVAVRSPDVPPISARTLATGGSGSSDWRFLSARRLALRIAASVERGTRWMLFEQNAPLTWARGRSLVNAYLERFAAEGAFAGASPEERYFVVCDERINQPDSIASGKVNLLFGIAARRAGEFDTWLVSHQPAASRARPVSVNRLATRPPGDSFAHTAMRH